MSFIFLDLSFYSLHIHFFLYLPNQNWQLCNYFRTVIQWFTMHQNTHECQLFEFECVHGLSTLNWILSIFKSALDELCSSVRLAPALGLMFQVTQRYAGIQVPEINIIVAQLKILRRHFILLGAVESMAACHRRCIYFFGFAFHVLLPGKVAVFYQKAPGKRSMLYSTKQMTSQSEILHCECVVFTVQFTTVLCCIEYLSW